MRAKHTVAVDYVGELLRNRGLMASYSEIACAADLAILRERCGSDRELFALTAAVYADRATEVIGGVIGAAAAQRIKTIADSL
jgi:phosphoenolpyruvate carboxylase